MNNSMEFHANLVGIMSSSEVLDGQMTEAASFLKRPCYAGLSKKLVTYILDMFNQHPWLFYLMNSVHNLQKQNRKLGSNLSCCYMSCSSSFIFTYLLSALCLCPALFSPAGLPPKKETLPTYCLSSPSPPPPYTPTSPNEQRSGAKYTWPWQNDGGNPAGGPPGCWHLGSLAQCQRWQCWEGLAGIMVFGWGSPWHVQIGEEAAKRKEQRSGLFIWGSNPHRNTHWQSNTGSSHKRHEHSCIGMYSDAWHHSLCSVSYSFITLTVRTHSFLNTVIHASLI